MILKSPPAPQRFVSICIPVYEEAENIRELYTKLAALARSVEDRFKFEFIFSDNNSNDNSWEIIRDLSLKDSRVKGLRFSRNFGFQRSILSNYAHAIGDAVVQIDADLQDPPEVIKQFLIEWDTNGFLVVYGVRITRSENIFLRIFRTLGYRLVNRLSEHPLPVNAGEFRLIDRRVLIELLKFKGNEPYIRGIVASLGFRQKGVEYSREKRHSGKSKFNISRLSGLGINAIFNHSTVPLKLASFVGVSIMLFALIAAIVYFLLRLSNPSWPPGIATIIILMMFSLGVQSFLMGILGEYLYRIFVMIRNEPTTIVEEYINIAPSGRVKKRAGGRD
jgi:dolichol-phosphate mannosyltransferase